MEEALRFSKEERGAADGEALEGWEAREEGVIVGNVMGVLEGRGYFPCVGGFHESGPLPVQEA